MVFDGYLLFSDQRVFKSFDLFSKVFNTTQQHLWTRRLRAMMKTDDAVFNGQVPQPLIAGRTPRLRQKKCWCVDTT